MRAALSRLPGVNLIYVAEICPPADTAVEGFEFKIGPESNDGEGGRAHHGAGRADHGAGRADHGAGRAHHGAGRAHHFWEFSPERVLEVVNIGKNKFPHEK